jgi:hypothetical protein
MVDAAGRNRALRSRQDRPWRTEVAEREDPAESTERRDFELPPDAEPSEGEPASRPPQAPAEPESDMHPEPADESERRDWDLPES